MKALRKTIFWLHLAIGLFAGAVIFVMSVTGVLLAFERQIVEWVESGHRVSPGGERQSIAVILANLPEHGATAISAQSDPRAPLKVSFGPARTLLVNPYTGAVLGDGARAMRELFHAVTDVHRWLGMHGASREAGRAITGACNLAFLFLVVSGFYLWWPRQWSANSLRFVTIPSPRLRGKARDFNWHNSLGFWCAPVLLFIVLTGALISYPWATSLLYRAAGSEPPPPRSGFGGGGREGASFAPHNLDQLWATAEQHVPGWRTISARFAGSPNAPLAFTIEQSHRGRPDLRSQLTLDPQTGEVIRWEPFSSLSLGRRLRTWGRWVHTGEAGGLPGQAVAALASAGAAVLVWTGLALSWRRFSNRRRRIKAPGDLPEPMRRHELIEAEQSGNG